jgi:hypothetical protein
VAHIVIDGYNLIRQSHSLSKIDEIDIEKGRNELIKRLISYKRTKGHTITVVFDGWIGGNSFETRERDRGINVIYSKLGEKADEVIKRISSEKRESVIIITSDSEIKNFAEKNRSVVIQPSDFERKMDMAKRDYKGEYKDNYIRDSISSINSRNKKGPSKKLSKKERRKRIVLKNL